MNYTLDSWETIQEFHFKTVIFVFKHLKSPYFVDIINISEEAADFAAMDYR